MCACTLFDGFLTQEICAGGGGDPFLVMIDGDAPQPQTNKIKIPSRPAGINYTLPLA